MVFFPVSFVFSFFVIFFPKLSSSILFFLILSLLEFNFIIKLNHVGKHCSFPHKTLWSLQCLSTWSFFLIIFSKKKFSIFFFNIELFENYNYMSLQIRLNHMGKHCSFHHKTLWIVTLFPTWFFFLFLCFVIFFSKIVSINFFFNIELIKNLAL